MHPRPPQLVESILEAYREGFFPMAHPGRAGRPSPIEWYSPDPRAIIPLREDGSDGGEFHASRSLRRRVRTGRFEIRTDTAFGDVILGCALPRPAEPESWIDERIVQAYTLLHESGYAHSIEAWLEGVLVGGLYGVHIGAAFFAESKFSLPDRGGTDASKVCLVHLVHHLRRRGFALLDVQFHNPHLEQFGIVELRRREYLARLASATAARAEWTPFDPEATRAEV